MLAPATHTLRILALLFLNVLLARAEPITLKEGTQFEIAGQTAILTKVTTLPYVESEYTRLFKFDSADNLKLKELRDRYKLTEIIRPATNEFEQQMLLLDWVHKRFQQFGQPTGTTSGALDILDGIEAGQTFFCTQYAQLFASAAASLGWLDRVLALRRHSDAGHTGSTEHSTTEIWSNQHRKWVMLDPTSNMYLEKQGVPLNAFEIRQEWFYNSGNELTFVIGKDKKRYRKTDLPIFLRSFPNFGDLVIDPHELDKYGFIGYIPNTDLMDSGFNYGQMFITKDELCDGTNWHKRKLPKNPATDPYFPVNQAAISLAQTGATSTVRFETLTPNFKQFEVKIDNTIWEPAGESFNWKPHTGLNSLQVRAINRFNAAGPISNLELKVQPR